MNQYQRSERQSYSAAVSLIIVLLAVAVGVYLYHQNDSNYNNTANSGISSNSRPMTDLQKK
jgi:hypothetical protein